MLENYVENISLKVFIYYFCDKIFYYYLRDYLRVSKLGGKISISVTCFLNINLFKIISYDLFIISYL